MEQFYSLAEICATHVESVVIFSAVTAASEPKRRGWVHVALILLLSVVSSGIVVIMNAYSVFSFLTPIPYMCYLVFIASKGTSKGRFVVRFTSCILSLLVIQTIDYILVVFIGFCYGVPGEIFTVFTTPGPRRMVYLFFDKLSDVLVYFAVRNHLKRINLLSKKLQTILFTLSIVAYGVMQLLFSAIITPNLIAMQITVISSWFLVLCFIVAVLALFSTLTKAEHDRQTQEMLRAENTLMAKNYQTLHTDRIENAKRLHDFIHHLKTVRGLLQNENYEESGMYIDSLLNVPYRGVNMCHSGSDIIDAIINCKAVEAEQDGIAFEFSADFHLPTSLDPVDVCGILSNQIDNALEACRSMREDSTRKVFVDIKQKENFAFFTVKNSVPENPLLDNPNLITTKKDQKTQHGLGIKNIRDTAEKNDGSLLYEYENGFFVSTVSLCFQLLDT